MLGRCNERHTKQLRNDLDKLKDRIIDTKVKADKKKVMFTVKDYLQKNYCICHWFQIFIFELLSIGNQSVENPIF